jgi:hypothetical protein
LGQVDGADPGQPEQQLGPWVLGDPLFDGCIELADGGLQAPQQLDLGGDQLAEHRRRQPDRWDRRGTVASGDHSNRRPSTSVPERHRRGQD